MYNNPQEKFSPYYQQGNVFQRDQRYYDQVISTTRKSRTPNKHMQTSNPQYNSRASENQYLRLKEQNDALKNQMQKLTYGAEFGTGDVVTKKHHYTSTHVQNQVIQEQEATIRKLQQTIQMNNQRLIGYQKGANELEVRMNNIQSIDKQIYKNLKGASMRDKELLDRASTALARGESREEITRILQQIIGS